MIPTGLGVGYTVGIIEAWNGGAAECECCGRIGATNEYVARRDVAGMRSDWGRLPLRRPSAIATGSMPRVLHDGRNPQWAKDQSLYAV